MKIYSFFTKTGRIEVPIQDQNQSQAESIARNPVLDLVDKVRELTDLSNKLTKVQLSVNDEVVKVEFTDVDGQIVTLRKDETKEDAKPQVQAKDNEWQAPKPEPKEPKVEAKPKDPFTDHKKIATEHVKSSVPLKHQESAKAYINSDHFKDDVTRHADNRQKEIDSLGYSQGPHPAIRALNEHLHPIMNKAEWAEFEKKTTQKFLDTLRNEAGNLAKGGPGSGRHPEGGSMPKGGKLNPKAPYEDIDDAGKPSRFHSETKHGMYHTFKTPNGKTGVIFKPTGSMQPERMTGEFNSSLDANSAILRHDHELGKVQKGGPGSGRHYEGGSKTGNNQEEMMLANPEKWKQVQAQNVQDRLSREKTDDTKKDYPDAVKAGLKDYREHPVTDLPKSVQQDVANQVGSIHRLNAPGSQFYGFNHDGKQISTGEYHSNRDFDNPDRLHSHVLDMKSGKLFTHKDDMGKMEKGGPGSGRHPEGGSENRFDGTHTITAKDHPIGSNRKIMFGSGIASGKTGTVVHPSEIKTDGRGIPTNVEGAYKPVDWKKETAIKYHEGQGSMSGKYDTMEHARLKPVEDDSETGLAD